MAADPMMAFGRSTGAEERSVDTDGLEPEVGVLDRWASPAPSRDMTETASPRALFETQEARRARRSPLIERRLDQLVQTIETDIVPRLLMAHPTGDGEALPHQKADTARPLGQAEIAAFTAMVLVQDVPSLLAVVDEYREGGVPLERIYLDLLAPTARRLGRMWEEDECDFATVTLGLHHLHGLLHACRPAFALEAPEPGRCALLSPAPGEQHVFGLAIVGEFLRHAGWEVTDAMAGSRRELADLVGARWFTVVGLTASSEGLLDSLTGCIRAIRKASCNPAIGILVGGRIFSDRPELVALVGADAAAGDGRAAVQQAERLRAHMAGATVA
jgi:methanogenic corrinoid protein MtbC1